MRKTLVEVRGLSRHYGKHAALDNVDFSIAAGRVYGIVGANGAGKTTLLKHLLGLLRPQSGTVAYSAMIRCATRWRCCNGSATCPNIVSCRSGCALRNCCVT